MKFVSSRLPGLAALALVAALILAASANAAAGTLQWTAPVAYGPSGPSAPVFDSIDCPNAATCVAAGETVGASLTVYQPAIALESNGVWGTVVTPTVASGTLVGLSSVSCTSASSCDAVGTYVGTSGELGIVIPFTISGTSLHEGTPTVLGVPKGIGQMGLVGISCASSCTAVGYGSSSSSGDAEPIVAFTSASGSWSDQGVSSVPAGDVGGALLSAISCPSSGACEAVGAYANASGNAEPWVTQVTSGAAGTAEAVRMPSDYVASALPLSSPVPFIELPGLAAISCPSAGVCTAAGSYVNTDGTASPVAVPITNGMPGTASELTPPTTSGSYTSIEPDGSYLNAISCSDASDCVVAGYGIATSGSVPAFTGLTGEETSGSWSVTPTVQSSISDTSISFPLLTGGLGCSAPGVCVASGIQVSEPSSGGETLNAFFTYSVPPLTISTSTLPTATVGVPYSATLAASGGNGSYSWSTGPGSLPAGLSLNATTGVISGTPTAAGQSGFVVNAGSAQPLAVSDSVGLSITVNPAATAAAAALSPSVRIIYLSTSGSKAVVILGCSGANCAGSLNAKTVVRVKGKTAHSKRKSKTVTLISGRYSVAVGGSKVLTLKLSKAALALLRKEHKLSGNLDVTPTGAHKAAVIKKLTFTTK